MGSSSAKPEPPPSTPEPTPPEPISGTPIPLPYAPIWPPTHVASVHNLHPETTVSTRIPSTSGISQPIELLTQQVSSASLNLNTNIHKPTKPPSPARAGTQTVKLAANNYIIPNKSVNRILDINVPHGVLPDRYTLRICPQYNDRLGCHVVTCRRFHVCIEWALKDSCKKFNCNRDHSFSSAHNQILESPLEVLRDFTLDHNFTLQMLKNNHSVRRRKHESSGEICMFNILRRCYKTPCMFTHATKCYQWEVLVNEQWLPLSFTQSDHLEEKFSKPEIELTVLPKLNTTSRRGASSKLEFKLDNKSWTVNFPNMIMNHEIETLPLRRLSTPSDVTTDFGLATRWLWYWQQDENMWPPYMDGAKEKYYILNLSDQLEWNKQYGRSPDYTFTVNNSDYVVNTSNMTQTNQMNTIREVRRRPAYIHKKEDNEIFIPDLFTNNLVGNNFHRQNIISMSVEYNYVKDMMEQSLFNLTICSMERIQNNSLWNAYKHKKQHMLSMYRGDERQVNEQFLFHGTKNSIIDTICKDNFDWRMFGSNVGYVYGQGAYFANKASLSHAYTEMGADGTRVMFVALVLVGTMTLGNTTMSIPPENHLTSKRFDTTTNSDTNPSIFVKYYLDEYYPLYLVKYKY